MLSRLGRRREAEGEKENENLKRHYKRTPVRDTKKYKRWLLGWMGYV